MHGSGERAARMQQTPAGMQEAGQRRPQLPGGIRGKPGYWMHVSSFRRMPDKANATTHKHHSHRQPL